MHTVQERTVPLHESGTAPRIFVHDIDRIESNGDGLYTVVCTSPIKIDGNAEQHVVIYIDTTWRVIAHGILLAVTHVAELTCLRNVIAQVNKAVRRLTVH